MIYVMSDLHGRYEAFLRMLEEIDFKDQDELFILGDIVDRGKNSMALIKDLSFRSNVFCLLGNHDDLATRCLHQLNMPITEEAIDNLDEGELEVILEWINFLDGNTTLRDFKNQSEDDREVALEYLEDMSLYQELCINKKQYILVHTLGSKYFHPDKKMSEYDLNDLLWERCDYGLQYYKSKILVTGHTPTKYISDNPKPGYIYINKNHIAIDCGMDRLGCLCLDTMEEFYIEYEEKHET